MRKHPFPSEKQFSPNPLDSMHLKLRLDFPMDNQGNPIFSTQDFMWELFPDMKSGQLTDESGNSSVFFQVIN